MTKVLATLVVVMIVTTPLYYRVSRDRDFRNLREVVPGVLYRSGQLTPDGFQRIVEEYRVGTVISLRDTVTGTNHAEQFENDYAQSHGIAFHRLSPKGWSSPTGEVPANETVAQFLAILANPNTKKPVLVHCFAGIHRTGGHVAAYRMEMCGWKSSDAMAEMKSMGTVRTTFADDLLAFVQNYVSKGCVGQDRRGK